MKQRIASSMTRMYIGSASSLLDLLKPFFVLNACLQTHWQSMAHPDPYGICLQVWVCVFEHCRDAQKCLVRMLFQCQGTSLKQHATLMLPEKQMQPLQGVDGC